RHTRSYGDWSSDVCSSDLLLPAARRAGDRTADSPCVLRSLAGDYAALGSSTATNSRSASGAKSAPFGQTTVPHTESNSARAKYEIGRASCRERAWSRKGER